MLGIAARHRVVFEVAEVARERDVLGAQVNGSTWMERSDVALTTAGERAGAWVVRVIESPGGDAEGCASDAERLGIRGLAAPPLVEGGGGFAAQKARGRGS